MVDRTVGGVKCTSCKYRAPHGFVLRYVFMSAVLHRYHSDTQAMKIAQGVAGTVKCKGSVSNTLPYFMQAVRQGFQVQHPDVCKRLYLLHAEACIHIVDSCIRADAEVSQHTHNCHSISREACKRQLIDISRAATRQCVD